MAPVTHTNHTMNHSPKCYRTFKRSCTDWRSFAKGRKIENDRNLTYDEAHRQCLAFNAERSASQKRRGTMMEFEIQ